MEGPLPPLRFHLSRCFLPCLKMSRMISTFMFAPSCSNCCINASFSFLFFSFCFELLHFLVPSSMRRRLHWDWVCPPWRRCLSVKLTLLSWSVLTVFLPVLPLAELHNLDIINCDISAPYGPMKQVFQDDFCRFLLRVPQRNLQSSAEPVNSYVLRGRRRQPRKPLYWSFRPAVGWCFDQGWSHAARRNLSK